MRALFPDWIGIWKCWFFRKEKKQEYSEKNSQSMVRTNNNLNPLMAPSRNRIRAALVGGECSHHYAIHAPHTLVGALQDLETIFVCNVCFACIFYLLCHLWWRAEQQSLRLFWHNCDVSPFSVEQNVRQTGHHALWKRLSHSSLSCMRFSLFYWA